MRRIGGGILTAPPTHARAGTILGAETRESFCNGGRIVESFSGVLVEDATAVAEVATLRQPVPEASADWRTDNTYSTQLPRKKLTLIANSSALRPVTVTPSAGLLVDESLYVRSVDGQAATGTVTLSDATGRTATVNLTLGAPSGTTLVGSSAPSADVGSLRAHILNAVIPRITGKTASTTTKKLYSVQDHTNAIYTRSTDCWGAGIDLTCASPWNSTGANTRAGTLVSPCHFVAAKHYPHSVGETIRFVTMDNQVITRTVTAATSTSYTDLQVCKLDSDVPPSITFARVLPTNWHDYLPTVVCLAISNLGNGHGPYPYLPCVQLDQEEKLLLSSLYGHYHADATRNATMVSWNPLPTDPWLSWYETIIGGDSGNPNFLLINDTPVLLYCFFGPGAGPDVSGERDWINATMTAQGGGHQLTDIDLTSFNNYAS